MIFSHQISKIFVCFKCIEHRIYHRGWLRRDHAWLLQDLDIWVNKTAENYVKLTKAFAIFGMPIFDMTEENFLGEKFDVFSIGRSPMRNDIITKLKGVLFPEAFDQSLEKEMENTKVRYLYLNDLFASKKAAGRFKDLDDLRKILFKIINHYSFQTSARFTLALHSPSNINSKCSAAFSFTIV